MILDLAAHAGFESLPGADARHTLKVRGTPSAHAIADRGGGMMRLVSVASAARSCFGRTWRRRRAGVTGGGDRPLLVEGIVALLLPIAMVS